AYVPIMTGCNNFCAYCVVPYVRGRERSRPVKDILAEVKKLIKNGYKEIILLGQNVNSYRGKLKVKSQKLKVIDFATLLKIINNIPGDFRIKFLTSHPKDMSDELIDAVAKLDKVVKYIHLPVQAGDNQVLKRMNRGYTVRHYKNLIKKIRAKIPGVMITTDIIVGFPSETKKQFEKSVKLFKEIKFDMAYIAQYSPRAGTAAAKMKDDVPKAEKKRRWGVLNNLLMNYGRR
ncbi:MAG: MiaB/RimO family radical SAM methylthiotransferase, partial [bacterium]